MTEAHDDIREGLGKMKGSREEPQARRWDREEMARVVVDCGFRLHQEVGPGLLESVYEVVLAKMLEERGLRVARQVAVPIKVMGMRFDEGFRADLIVEEALWVELKSVEHLAPVYS